MTERLTAHGRNRRWLLGSGLAMPLLALAAPTTVPPSRARGTGRANVRSTGARGDGRHDDTAAFQRAIDGLPEDGGIVDVPAGRYRIDATRSVCLRNRTHLRLAQGAELVALPNAAERAFVLSVQEVADVTISGGRIIGDRKVHQGTTGEWGHGIAVYGARRVSIADMRIDDCWGDGISVAQARPKRRSLPRTPSEDVAIVRVACHGNRRQGLSIGHVRGVLVSDCDFHDTGGTAPQCGIDIEPDACCQAHEVLIEHCRIGGNRGSGIQIYKRTFDITVRDCTIRDNAGYGILAVGTRTGRIIDNRIEGNGLPGVYLRSGTADYAVRGNRFRGNGGRMQREKERAQGARSNLLVAKDTSGIRLGGNRHLQAP